MSYGPDTADIFRRAGSYVDRILRGEKAADLPAYVARVGIFRDLNAAVLRLSPTDLARMVIDELTRAGAIRIEGGDLVPAAAG